MSQDRVRLALIGAGAMANAYHYPSLASFPDVELAAICDLDEDKAAATAHRFGIPEQAVYGDYRRMLDATAPDVVYLLMPPHHLYGLAHDILSRGLHLFVEKPLALTVQQAQMLAYTAGEHDCLTMVGFQRRYIPAMTVVRSRVEEAGPIVSARVAFLKSTADLSQPAGFYEGAIDPFTSDGVHAVDTLRWLCGGEVEEVQSVVRRRMVAGPLPNVFTALVTFSTGAVGTLEYNLVTGRRVFSAEFHSLNRTGIVDADRMSLFVQDNGIEELLPSEAYGEAAAAGGTLSPWHWLGFWHENRHFIDAIKANAQPSSNFADAVKTMVLTQRIYGLGEPGLGAAEAVRRHLPSRLPPGAARRWPAQ